MLLFFRLLLLLLFVCCCFLYLHRFRWVYVMEKNVSQRYTPALYDFIAPLPLSTCDWFSSVSVSCICFGLDNVSLYKLTHTAPVLNRVLSGTETRSIPYAQCSPTLHVPNNSAQISVAFWLVRRGASFHLLFTIMTRRVSRRRFCSVLNRKSGLAYRGI